LVVESPIRCIETNVVETARVLRFAVESMTPVLLASTSEVYGKSDRVPFGEEDDVVYGATTEPRWAYACSKAIDEHLGLSWHRSVGLPVIAARFFNTVGPRQRGKWGMVLPRFVAAALRGEALRVHGDGAQERCFVDVRDVVPVLQTLMETPKAYGQVVNIGHDDPVTIQGLAERVVSVLDSTSVITHVSIEEDYGRPIEDLRRRIPDLARLRALTGLIPRISLDQTIRDIAACVEESSP